MNPAKVSILGPGLLGGSIALGLRARGFAGIISLWARRPTAVEEIRQLQLPVEATNDLAASVTESDLVVFCTPVEVMSELMRQALPDLKSGCIVTDVGSVKTPVVIALEKMAAHKIRVVGSHPMAGSEQAGIQFAKADLFQNSVCVVTPTPETDPEAIASVEIFWKNLGANVLRFSPEAHDHAVARISHLPHIVAAALVNVNAEKNHAGLAICGKGFLDITRIASGSPTLWTGIVEANRAEVISSIQEMIENLISAKEILENAPSDRIKAYLQQAKSIRDTVKATRNHGTVQS